MSQEDIWIHFPDSKNHGILLEENPPHQSALLRPVPVNRQYCLETVNVDSIWWQSHLLCQFVFKLSVFDYFQCALGELNPDSCQLDYLHFVRS